MKKMDTAELSRASVIASIEAFRGRGKGGSVKRLLRDRKNDSEKNEQKNLLTGGSGLLGSHLCKRMFADGHEVV